MSPKSASFSLLLVALFACSDPNAPQRVAAAPPSTSQMPAGHPNVSDAAARGTAMPKSLPGTSTTAAGLSFTTPAGWIAERPSNQMRILQFRLPHADGDQDDAEVYVTGTVGGTRQANLDRWIGEIEQPDGRPSKDVAKVTTRKVGALEAIELDLTGTSAPSAGMGAAGAPAPRKEGWRNISTILEDGSGTVGFVRVRGPIATVSKWEQAYRAFVDSAKVAQ
jgi:hypothetical protein